MLPEVEFWCSPTELDLARGVKVNLTSPINPATGETDNCLMYNISFDSTVFLASVQVLKARSERQHIFNHSQYIANTLPSNREQNIETSVYYFMGQVRCFAVFRIDFCHFILILSIFRT